MNYRDMLQNDVDKIEEILAKLGFSHISYKGKSLRFGFDETGDPTRFNFCMDRMKFMDFRDGESGDLIDLIKLKRECGTYKAVNWLQLILGGSIGLTGKIENVLKTLGRTLDDMGVDPENLMIYEDDVLDRYHNGYYKLFLEDGVGALAHIVFDIRFDEEINRILIPVRDENGNLVGIIGRYNHKEVPPGMSKYLPSIPYPKKQVVYGVWENKNYLNDTVYIVESEKTVQQAFSMGYRNVVAIGGNRISDEQLSILRRLNPKRMILLLDKGLKSRKDKDHYLEQAKKLISKNPFIKYLVGYLDANMVEYIPDKASPFDLDKETCQRILDNEITYIGGLR